MHTDALVVLVLAALTLTVNVLVQLLHPPALATVIFPVYKPAGVPAGTLMVMGLAGNGALVTATKLLAGAAFQVMLYVVGLLVVAL